MVSASIIDDLGNGRVAVWWPSRRKGKQWEGVRVNVTTENSKCSNCQPTLDNVLNLHGIWVYVCNKLLAIVRPESTTLICFVTHHRPPKIFTII